MTTIRMNAGDAVTIANLIHLTDAKTPRLDVIHLSTLAGETMALASDRFILGRVMADTQLTGDPVEWRLTANAAKFLTANVKPLNKWHDPAPVVFELNGDHVTITAGAATYADNIPAPFSTRSTTDELSRVLDGWRAVDNARPVSLATRFLLKLGKLTDGFTKVDGWLIELGEQQNATGRHAGPIRAKSERVELLIQPRVIPTT